MYLVGRTESAKKYFERALRAASGAGREGHPHVLVAAHFLGLLEGRPHERALQQALPMLEKVVGLRARLRPHDPETATAMACLAEAHALLGNGVAARPLLEDALSVYAEAGWAERPEAARAMNRLGTLLLRQGDAQGAWERLEEAVRVLKEALGPEHAETAVAMVNLSEALSALGNDPAARLLLEDAVVALRAAAAAAGAGAGAEEAGAQLRTAVHRLGLLYNRAGDNAAAHPCFEESVQLHAEAMGEGHPDTATALMWQAETSALLGDDEAAERLLRHALWVYEECGWGGTQHAGTAAHKLGLLLRRRGDVEGAVPFFEDSFRAHEAALGRTTRTRRPRWSASLSATRSSATTPPPAPAVEAYRRSGWGEHRAMGAALHRLGVAMRQGGAFAEALPVFEEAARVQAAALGPEHPDALTSLLFLGEMHSLQGEEAVAQRVLEEVLRVRMRVLGAEHPECATAAHFLASTYSRRGQWDLARGFHQEALRIRLNDPGLGPQHLDTASSMAQLASALIAMGRDGEARPLLEEAIRVTVAARGVEHRDTAWSINELAVLLCRQEKHEEARPLFEEALRIYAATLGPEHPNTAQAMRNLAVELIRADQPEAAVPLLKVAAVVFERAFGAGHEKAAEARRSLQTAEEMAARRRR
eukprot:tig00021339_g20437.t1